MVSCVMSGNVVKLIVNHTSECTVNLCGATLTSWKNKGQEVLFCSEKAVLDGTKAIRGGIPIVFPNFGPWDLGPQHGFARIKPWKLTQENNDGSDFPTFILEDDEDTRKMWNYKFRLTYRVEFVEDSLTTSLTVDNTGTEAFSFTTLLHTYFRIPDINKMRIKGLNSLNFVDKVHGGEHTESRDHVFIDENYDRIYKNSTGPVHLIVDIDNPTALRQISSQNLPDIVVWNPWADKAKGMSDFDDSEYLSMVCIETGAVSDPVLLQAKQNMTFSQTISLNKESKI